MSKEQVLKQMGFSKNEIDIYLATLENGLSSAQEIARKARLKRTTAYSVLEYLVNRGIVSKTKIKDKTRFMAEPPVKLLKSIANLQDTVSKIIPELEAIYNVNSIKPKITFYEGDEAIQNVYDDTLKEKPDEILEWNTNKYFLRFPKEHNYIQQRVSLNIKARRMTNSGSQWHKIHKKKDKEELAETIVLPKEKFNPQIEVNIYNNKIAFLNYAEEMSVIIESKAIADAMKEVYELSCIGARTMEVTG